jgi:WD40 repeat protein
MLGEGGQAMRSGFVTLAVGAVVSVAPTAAADPPAPRAVLALPGPAGPLAFTPDGAKLITTGADKPSASGGQEVRIWDVATGKPLAGPLTGRGIGLSLAVSSDGGRALTGGLDGFARLWDLGGSKAIAELTCYTPKEPGVVGGARVERVGFAPGGKTAATVEWQGATGLVRVWDATTGKPAGEPRPRASLTAPLQFTPEGAVAPAPAEKGGPLPPDPKRISFTLSDDGKRAITGGADGRAVLWDYPAGKPIGEPLMQSAEKNPPWVGAAAFSPDGKRVAIGTQRFTKDDARVVVLDPETRAVAAGPFAVDAASGKGKQGGVTRVVFSPNGKILAVVVTRRGPGAQTLVSEVQLWELPGGK